MAIGNEASRATPPVGSGAAVETPVIALFLACGALRASKCNRWPRAWVSGQGCEWHREDDALGPGGGFRHGGANGTGETTHY